MASPSPDATLTTVPTWPLSPPYRYFLSCGFPLVARKTEQRPWTSPQLPTIRRSRQGRAKAFRDAIWLYAEWWREPEPHVSLDLEPVLISTACEAVLPFNDPLPESVFEKLFSFLQRNIQC